MKKLAGLAAAGAMLLGMALPVLANGTVVINRGWAVQNTSADADANSGAQKGGDIEVDGGLVLTGDAMAVALSSSVANQFSTGVLSDCGCHVFVWNRGGAFQDTDADADANTGAQKGGDIELGYDEEWDSEGDSGVGTGNATAVTGASAWANIFTTQVLSVGLLED